MFLPQFREEVPKLQSTPPYRECRGTFRRECVAGTWARLYRGVGSELHPALLLALAAIPTPAPSLGPLTPVHVFLPCPPTSLEPQPHSWPRREGH